MVSCQPLCLLCRAGCWTFDWVYHFFMSLYSCSFAIGEESGGSSVVWSRAQLDVIEEFYGDKSRVPLRNRDLGIQRLITNWSPKFFWLPQEKHERRREEENLAYGHMIYETDNFGNPLPESFIRFLHPESTVKLTRLSPNLTFRSPWTGEVLIPFVPQNSGCPSNLEIQVSNNSILKTLPPTHRSQLSEENISPRSTIKLEAKMEPEMDPQQVSLQQLLLSSDPLTPQLQASFPSQALVPYNPQASSHLPPQIQHPQESTQAWISTVNQSRGPEMVAGMMHMRSAPRVSAQYQELALGGYGGFMERAAPRNVDTDFIFNMAEHLYNHQAPVALPTSDQFSDILRSDLTNVASKQSQDPFVNLTRYCTPDDRGFIKVSYVSVPVSISPCISIV